MELRPISGNDRREPCLSPVPKNLVTKLLAQFVLARSGMTPVSSSSLLQMRANILTQNDALQRAAGRAGTQPAGAASFGDAMMDAVKAVNTQQTQATQASEAYERGETNDLVGVMLARQKASVSFEATLQVRNKLLGAYRDIMNMPV